ncbi:hypothetical protein [Bacillus sp. HSf4]|uniref:hypothetical protein n=1 Tax=Bacillus sp. HSf4 TaxID=3035514 RepID=UPI002409C94E|nr:hypothetical protein [Bacillus sp. HSf4]WFA06580.1 hypothetical protein P3X63_07330 [Bacillus sp. HSf4]
MDIQKPRRFETSDRAHADIFNEMLDQLNENDELVGQRAEEAEKNAKAYADTHASKKDNPHGVTKEQVGLGQVDNIQQAAKTEFDSHQNDSIRHITDLERDKWNNAQLIKITSDTGLHKIGLTSGSFFDALKDLGTVTFYGTNEVTDTPSSGSLRGMQLVGQKGIGMGYAVDTSGNAWWFYYNTNHTEIQWIPIESTDGAQEKVDTHANNASIHITSEERSKWNNAQLYKFTKDDGVRIFIPDGTDLLSLPAGYYYGVNNRLLNNPDPSDKGWFNYDILDGNSGRKTIIATASYHNTMWFATIHTDGDFRGWKRVLTDADASVSWQSPTLVNGWFNYDDSQQVKFSKNALGEVEIIGAMKGGTVGFDVPAFTLPEGYRPVELIHFAGIASSKGMNGMPQFHRTFIHVDGRVCIQYSSNPDYPNEFIAFSFKFKAA